MRPSADVTSPGKAGSTSTLIEVNASAKDATTSEVSAVCTVHCKVEVLESQFSGWRPVWLTANLGTARCHERKNPKGGQTREGGWEEQSSSRLTLVFLVFTLCVGCHTESSANSLREVSEVSLQLTAEGRSPPRDRYQFWSWCPLNLKENRSSAAAQRANYHVDIRLSICHDLEHHATLRSERAGRVLLTTTKRNLGVTVNP